MTVLPVTLSTLAAAAILTIWLMARTGRVRAKSGVVHGDGGNPQLTRRMRAQLNFVESAPFILLLIAAIELSGRGGLWLSIVAGLYIVGRVCHALGMDGEEVTKLRGVGVAVTMLTLLGLAVYAALIAGGVV